MTTTLRLFTTSLALVGAACTLHAQTELGLSVGLGGYDGDLGASTLQGQVANLQTAIGMYGRTPLTDRVGINIYVEHYKIQGDDVDRVETQQRNLSFNSTVLELGAAAELYPFGIDRAAAPFVSVGASVYRFNPQTEFNGRQVELQPLGTEGQGLPGYAPKYGLTRFAIPVGVGVRIPFGDAWVVGAQARMRLTFFDYLDDVSGNYVNYYELVQGSGSLSAALADRTGEYLGVENRDIPSGSPRGKASNNDVTYTASITVGYRLGTGLFSGNGRSSSASRYNKCYRF